MCVFLSDGFDLLCGTARDASVELGDELGEVVSRVAAVSLQCRSLSPHVQEHQRTTDKSSRHNCTHTHASAHRKQSLCIFYSTTTDKRLGE